MRSRSSDGFSGSPNSCAIALFFFLASSISVRAPVTQQPRSHSRAAANAGVTTILRSHLPGVAAMTVLEAFSVETVMMTKKR